MVPPPGAKNSTEAYESGACTLMLLPGAWVTWGSPCPFWALGVPAHLWGAPSESGRTFPNFSFGSHAMVSARSVRTESRPEGWPGQVTSCWVRDTLHSECPEHHDTSP